MGIKLSELMAGRCERRIPFGDQALTVGYRPYAEHEEEAILARHGGIWTNAAVRDFLATFVADWDLTDDDGAPLPREAEALRAVSMDILGPIFLDIRNSLNPPTLTSGPKSVSSLAG